MDKDPGFSSSSPRRSAEVRPRRGERASSGTGLERRDAALWSFGARGGNGKRWQWLVSLGWWFDGYVMVNMMVVIGDVMVIMLTWMYTDVYPLVSSNVAIGIPLEMEASIGKSPIIWVCSIAMFDYRRVTYCGEAVEIPVRLCQHSQKNPWWMNY